MPLPDDYTERVYAGVLGKVIGVYLGRPIEGWSYEQITARLGEVRYYVHDRPEMDLPTRQLVVTDDDLSGTFTFLRALPDYGHPRDLTPAQIGQTWLNYIVEGRSTLAWAGMGNASEHTAYLRLKSGIPAPRSGSLALNGQWIAEQIGAQIFVDGWAMVAPGDPELAADLARRAASVSHDGEAVYAAQLLAAMEALAFVEPRLERLLDTGLALIRHDSVIYRLVSDVREWHARFPDWRTTRTQLATHYGLAQYPDLCYVVPNHGLIHLGLLYGQDDFQQSLMITNTAGWDTDCNSGNVGCLLGIKNGLPGLDAGPDWRGPVADRLYLSSADGGRAITDAVIEAYHIANSGRALNGLAPLKPKQGARFHFSLPGSVQGFRPQDAALLALENAGDRGLALHYRTVRRTDPARASTATFIPPDSFNMPTYELLACPTLYPGQTLRASVVADPANRMPVTARLYIAYYGADDNLVRVAGPRVWLPPSAEAQLEWRLESAAFHPIAEVGLELSTEQPAKGTVYVDHLGWDGQPELVFERPDHGGQLWRRAWVDAVDHWERGYGEAFRLAQDSGTGLLIQGSRGWTDYEVSTSLNLYMAAAGGLAVRVQGLRRYYALLLSRDFGVRLVKALDGDFVLDEVGLEVAFGRAYTLSLRATGPRLQAWVDGKRLFDIEDSNQPLTEGAIGLVCQEGTISTNAVGVRPV